MHVLLNARAGKVLDMGRGDPAELVRQLFRDAGQEAEVRMCEPAEIGSCLDDLLGAEKVVVGGGDGTVAQAVTKLTGSDTALGILPFGTLNLLARDLGIPLAPEEAITALAQAVPRRIDMATLNGRPFHTLSGLGFFSEIARAREEVRGLKLPFGRYVAVAVSAVRALRRVSPMMLDIELDGIAVREEAYALLVTNNAFDGPGWNRGRLDEGVLEVHIAHEAGFAEKLKAGVDMLADAWRDNPGIRSHKVRRLTVAQAGRQRLWVATDGEIGRENAPLNYEIRPGSLLVLGGRR